MDGRMADSRHKRQIAIKEFGETGQQLLAGAKIAVIGAGGVGCPALSYLACAGVGCIRIIDGDEVSDSNLQRQILFREEDFGKNKAVAAAETLKRLDSRLEMEPVPKYFSQDTAQEILRGCNLALDCTDKASTNALIQSCCSQFGVLLIRATAVGFGGCVDIIPSGMGMCPYCLYGGAEPPHPSDVGTMGAAVGAVGAHAALEAIKILSHIASYSRPCSLRYDGLSGKMTKLNMPIDACIHTIRKK